MLYLDSFTPRAFVYLGSCLTWADVYLGSCLPGQLLVHQSKHSNYEGSCQKLRKRSKIEEKELAKTIFSICSTIFFLSFRGSLLWGYLGFAAFLPALTYSYPLLLTLNMFDPILSHQMFLDTKSLLESKNMQTQNKKFNWIHIVYQSKAKQLWP